MAELADAHGLGPCAARRAGSSPVPGTMFVLPATCLPSRPKNTSSTSFKPSLVRGDSSGQDQDAGPGSYRPGCRACLLSGIDGVGNGDFSGFSTKFRAFKVGNRSGGFNDIDDRQRNH